MDWFNNWLFLAPIGNIPSAEDEEPYYAMLDDTPVAALFEPKGTDNPGACVDAPRFARGFSDFHGSALPSVVCQAS